APGANECLPGAQICARFVRGSHRGGAPTAKNQNRPRTVGAPAPGANGGQPGALICARFVRGSHRGGAPTTKPKPPANRRSTRPGCEWGLPGTLICARFVSRFAPGRCSYRKKPKPALDPVGAPAPGANGFLPAPYPVIG